VNFLSILKTFVLKKRKKAKLVWLGLDHAGKTTLVKRITTGEFLENPSRTMGLNIDRLSIDRSHQLEFVSWDLGGQAAFRKSIWDSYLADAAAIIFVVDSADSARFIEAKEELWRYVFNNPQIQERTPILILANKQDLPNAVNAGTLANALGLEVTTSHSYMILGVSALTGFHIPEALEWLGDRVISLAKKTT
jgi:small GTP-binding protein